MTSTSLEGMCVLMYLSRSLCLRAALGAKFSKASGEPVTCQSSMPSVYTINLVIINGITNYGLWCSLNKFDFK